MVIQERILSFLFSITLPGTTVIKKVDSLFKNLRNKLERMAEKTVPNLILTWVLQIYVENLPIAFLAKMPLKQKKIQIKTR
jgi:hypothetical protein